MDSLISNTAAINGLLARFGVKFGIYKNGEFHEQLFPYDSLPRIIPADEFAEIEAGLIQRVDALNAFSDMRQRHAVQYRMLCRSLVLLQIHAV